MDEPKLKTIPFQPSTVETIDYAVYRYINEEMNLFCDTTQGFKKVEVIWASAERAFMAKRAKEARDKEGAINYPLITIERTSYAKDPTFKGTAYGNIDPERDNKRGSIQIARRIKQNKTQNFVNAYSKRKSGQINFVTGITDKTVYETITIPMPVYVTVMYVVKLKTLYQQQMNQLLQPFMTQTGGINYFIAKHEGHRFECFIQDDYSLENNGANLADEERRFETEIQIKTLGHLIGKGVNQESPQIVVRENAVEVKVPREHIILGDSPEWESDSGYVGIGGLGSKK